MELTQNLLELVNGFSKAAGHKINVQKNLFYFYALATINQKLKEKYHFKKH